jgi:hypothetical protein
VVFDARLTLPFPEAFLREVRQARARFPERFLSMMTLASTLFVAAAGWSFLYLLFGGGIGGAILIFIVLKMLGH